MVLLINGVRDFRPVWIKDILNTSVTVIFRLKCKPVLWFFLFCATVGLMCNFGC